MVFVEQPLALPRSAIQKQRLNLCSFFTIGKKTIGKKCFDKNHLVCGIIGKTGKRYEKGNIADIFLEVTSLK